MALKSFLYILSENKFLLTILIKELEKTENKLKILQTFWREIISNRALENMKDKNWQQVKQILAQALEKTPSEREEFLTEACKTNMALKKEVMALLAYDEQVEGFLSTPIVEIPLAATLQSQTNQQNANHDKPRSLQEMLISLIGETLDNKYLIEEQLGQGGMGAVFKATHLGTDRPVALKIINPQFMTNDEFIERFKREAKAAGRLSHPNVVNVTDFGFTKIGIDNIAYLVMEYLNGYTLATLLEKKKKFPLEFVVDIIEQTCLAIGLAHKQGIIHRDLKPDNIWLEPNERGGYNVKVLDFGVAKLRNTVKNNELEKALPNHFDNIKEGFNQIANNSSSSTLIKDHLNSFSKASLTVDYRNNFNIYNLGSSSETAITEKHSTLENLDPTTEGRGFTEVGAIIGTPTYMSPEQCKGWPLDTSSDIYSLGVIVYKMLSGEAPFKGDIFQIMFSHSNIAAPQLKEKCPKLPTRITDLVMSTLVKDPEKRPVSAIAFATALKTAMEGDSKVLGQGVDLFRNNFVKFFRVSALINLPIVMFSGILICYLQQDTSIYPGFEQVPFLWWLLPLLIIMLAGKLNILAFAPVINQMHNNKTIDIPTKQILLSLTTNLPKMLITTAYGSLATVINLVKFIIPGFRKYIELIMSPCVVGIEHLEGKPALERSSKLIKPIQSLAISIQLRSLLTGFTIFFLSFLPFCLDELTNFSDQTIFSFRVEKAGFYMSAFMVVLLIPGLIATFVQPVIAMAFLQLYFKSRRILGEQTSNTNEQAKTDIFIPTYPLRKNRSKLVLASLMIVMLLLSSVSYILFVPPAKIAQLNIPKVQPISDSENAWIEYKLALSEIIKTSMVSNLKPLEVYSEGTDLKTSIYDYPFTVQLVPYQNFYDKVLTTSELTEQQKSFLDIHKTAIDYLIAGTKKPKAQYYKDLTTNTPELRMLPVLALTSITLAQAHRLMLDGKAQEAIDMILVVHRMSVDLMSEPYAPIDHHIIGNIVRNKIIKSLFIWMNSSSVNSINYLSLVKTIEDSESSVIPPAQIMSNGYIDFEHKIREVLINSNINDDYDSLSSIYSLYSLNKIGKLIEPFYGLRLRMYNNLIQNYTSDMDDLSLYIKTHNFVGMKKHITEKANRPFYSWSPTLETFFARFVLDSVALSNHYSNFRNFYVFQSSELAWKALAMCFAYKKANGHFPLTLEDAFANTGISIPYDPVTNKPIRYRLENGVPIVWLVGFDGVDDGGKIGCTYENSYSNLSGKDWIFRLGEVPFWYTPIKK